jgi:putative phosphonate metabolism protein
MAVWKTLRLPTRLVDKTTSLARNELEHRRGPLSPPAPRYAIYYAPEPGSALAQFGARCLGRDVQTGSDVPHHELTGFSSGELIGLTREPRRYGFHGTLKAPFRLTDLATERDLIDRLRVFAAGRRPFAVAPLILAEIAGFLALIPAEHPAPLHDLAAECVREFDDLRAQPTSSELARRLASNLTSAQQLLLARWGYPYVMEEFRFHLTLTDKLPAEAREPLKAALATLAATFAQEPFIVRDVALFRQPEPDAPFTVFARFPFAGD